ncbi:hypothetical protein JYQ62_07390 [Nostoc sp. UHCC 0702]|nr:hypothetical protein JYQ62_07390 [Nostoc sp. UHCC 0702]
MRVEGLSFYFCEFFSAHSKVKGTGYRALGIGHWKNSSSSPSSPSSPHPQPPTS